MISSFSRRLTMILLPVSFAASVLMGVPAQAKTDRLVIESGDNALSRQHAAMEKEQWDDTRSLRRKVNRRTEKEWDKTDTAFDARDNCLKSANVNAYWEPDTLRCLDRSTGRTIHP
ncbi:DUF1283 family protein [Apirhabdus apintestini]|uniref:DUF1283 family protein n=1 Tax=Erwinia sp. HR93 TaxID=3094840 RepID=UPI002ADEDF6D|nr:DUF1283 family protein [Erwinia sp. HR93]MEA1065044.1 DUF1283 family protein [Erwinia sp. HR93]WPM85766.1 DUF1283 family protein [Enterobacteriaceae bacterium CA-0114]